MGGEGEEEWRGVGWFPGDGAGESVRVGEVEWVGGDAAEWGGVEELGWDAERRLLGEGALRGVATGEAYGRLHRASEDAGEWRRLDLYSDGGADGVGGPAATAEYGWLVASVEEGEALQVLAEGLGVVDGEAGDMDSTRAELMGAYAVLHRVRRWRGLKVLHVDNMAVVEGLERRLKLVPGAELWARAERAESADTEGRLGGGANRERGRGGDACGLVEP